MLNLTIRSCKHWGKGIVNTLSQDLRAEFPEVRAFSRTNLFNVLKWYRFYSTHKKLVQTVSGLIPTSDIQKDIVAENVLPDRIPVILTPFHGAIISPSLTSVASPVTNKWCELIIDEIGRKVQGLRE